MKAPNPLRPSSDLGTLVMDTPSSPAMHMYGAMEHAYQSLGYASRQLERVVAKASQQLQPAIDYLREQGSNLIYRTSKQRQAAKKQRREDKTAAAGPPGKKRKGKNRKKEKRVHTNKYAKHSRSQEGSPSPSISYDSSDRTDYSRSNYDHTLDNTPGSDEARLGEEGLTRMERVIKRLKEGRMEPTRKFLW